MKVGTDGCLLGAWADVTDARRLLDVGCGSGLVAIMAAQRSDARITAVEIDGDAAAQARENAARSPWAGRIEVIHCDVAGFSAVEPFDAIVCNPPFFTGSMKNKDDARVLARHDDTLPCALLLQKAKELLCDGGTLTVVIPRDVSDTWCCEGRIKGLSPRRIAYVRTLPHKPAKRALVEFVKGVCVVPAVSELVLETAPGVYSDDARLLFRDFYLNL